MGVGGGSSVPAVIVGIDRIACGVQRPREPGVAAAVLGQTVGDLDDGARRRGGLPAVNVQGSRVRAGERERIQGISLPDSGASSGVATRLSKSSEVYQLECVLI
jgi:hypothetical protein